MQKGTERDVRLDSAVDRLEIIELLNRHPILIDAADPHAYADLYAENGSYESPFGKAQGRQALVDMSRSLHASGFTRGKRHLSGPIAVELHDDHATAKSYYWVAETEQFPPVIVSTGEYLDELVRTREGWRLASRRQTIDPNWLLGRNEEA